MGTVVLHQQHEYYRHSLHRVSILSLSLLSCLVGAMLEDLRHRISLKLPILTSFSESCSIFHNLERTSASTTETVAAEQQHSGSASEIRRHRTLQQRISTSRPKYFSSTTPGAAPSIQ